MAILDPSMEKNTEEPSYSQPALLVSPRVEPGSKEARKTTAGYGMKLSECLESSSPLGRFSRILLASEMWASPEFYLRWEGSAITSEYLLFRLVPSVPLIGESDTGLWRTPQADNAEQGPKKLETIQAQASPVITLTDQTRMIGAWATPRAEERQQHNSENAGMSTGAQLQAASARPTPTSRDGKGKTQNPERMDYVPNIVKAGWPTPRSEDSESSGVHRGNPDTLTSAARSAAWPTPDASEAGKTSRGGDRIDEPLIGGLIRKPWGTPRVSRGKFRKKDGEKMITLEGQVPGVWPTPKAELSGPDFARRDRDGSGGDDLVTAAASGMTPLGSLALTEKFAERLEILSCWLMGYPAAFLRLWPKKAGRTARSSPPSGMR
jgi:hypothetical protein